MNIQRILGYIKKEMIHILKDPAYLFLVVIFPIVLTAAFGLSFGSLNTNSNSSYVIAVINNDQMSTHPEWATNFMGNLSPRFLPCSGDRFFPAFLLSWVLRVLRVVLEIQRI
jgi:hypothetical protein